MQMMKNRRFNNKTQKASNRLLEVIELDEYEPISKKEILNSKVTYFSFINRDIFPLMKLSPDQYKPFIWMRTSEESITEGV